MTREEAIKEINKVFEPAFANYIIIALTEGATPSDKALEQQPCDDCISREDALMALTGDITDCTVEEYIARLRNRLSKLPSVTPKKTETWNGIHTQITAPKDTLEQIFNDADDDDI